MTKPLTFGSVCSGIEAASVAWPQFEALWLSEIEPFPCAVLDHHYPFVPNLGDMKGIAQAIRAGKVPCPDILVGGTPCQSFSVAGMRKGMADDRGALSLCYVDIANAIDEERKCFGEPECVAVWENVPGVLSDKSNAFGCFLGALAGEDCELQPPGGRWKDAGCVYGPQRAIAWRILDAQFFGLAQRRRRVFVVASARNGFDPAAVLFEREGVRRDIAPSREASQKVAGTTDRGSWWDGSQISQTLDAVLYKGQTMPEKNRFPAVLVPAIPIHDKATRYQGGGPTRGNDGSANGLGVGKDGDPYPTIGAHDIHAVCHRQAVRRITPREAERLQGFPDDYTLVLSRGKLAVDSPRYKALGNSMATNVMHWIGARIEKHAQST